MERTVTTRFEHSWSLPAQAGGVYYAGRLLAMDGSGRAAPAADAPGLVVCGLCSHTVSNAAGAHGDVAVPYRTGSYLMQNDEVNPLTAAHINKPCFIKDDITVSASPGTHNIFAGFFRGFHNNGSGVWLDTQFMSVIAHFFGNNPDSNFRFSGEPATGAPIFQLWNQAQLSWQTVQLDGLPGLERLLIAPAA